MKKLSTTRRTRKVCVLVCVVSLLIMGVGSFTSTSSLQHLLYGGDFLNHELTKELIKHIQIQEIPLFSRDTHEVNRLEPPISRDANEVNQDGQVSQDNIIKDSQESKDNTIDYKLINTNYKEEAVLRTKDVKYKGPSLESPYEIVIRRENVDSKMKGTRKGCTKTEALLKVFMYDLPPELHFGMIEPLNVKDGNIWPLNFTKMVSYPGGLYLQHSPEFWLTLDLLSNFEEEEGGHKDLLKEEEEKKDDEYEEEEEEEERGHNMFNSSYSRVNEGHANNEVKGNAIYNTLLERRGHYINDFLNPKEEKETLKEYVNTKIEVNNNMFFPKVERGHDIDSSHAKGERRRPCGAIRVKHARDADVYFVPFFSCGSPHLHVGQ